MPGCCLGVKLELLLLAGSGGRCSWFAGGVSAAGGVRAAGGVLEGACAIDVEPLGDNKLLVEPLARSGEAAGSSDVEPER